MQVCSGPWHCSLSLSPGPQSEGSLRFGCLELFVDPLPKAVRTMAINCLVWRALLFCNATSWFWLFCSTACKESWLLWLNAPMTVFTVCWSWFALCVCIEPRRLWKDWPSISTTGVSFLGAGGGGGKGGGLGTLVVLDVVSWSEGRVTSFHHWPLNHLGTSVHPPFHSLLN